MRRPDLAVLEQRIAALDQLRQRIHRRRHAARRGQRIGLFQRQFHAGRPVETGCGARVLGSEDAPYGRAARGSLIADTLNLLQVRPRALLGRRRGKPPSAPCSPPSPDASGLRPDFPHLASPAIRLGFGLQLLDPIGNTALKRRPLKRSLRRLLETGGAGRIFR